MFSFHPISEQLNFHLHNQHQSYQTLFEDGFENNLYFWIVRIIIIFPLYQILLIIIGTIFGEFRYFWRIEKKILMRLKIIKSSSS